jgi:hypothetical protein
VAALLELRAVIFWQKQFSSVFSVSAVHASVASYKMGNRMSKPLYPANRGDDRVT